MVGTRQVHVARPSWRRQPGSEALKNRRNVHKDWSSRKPRFPGRAVTSKCVWKRLGCDRVCKGHTKGATARFGNQKLCAEPVPEVSQSGMYRSADQQQAGRER